VYEWFGEICIYILLFCSNVLLVHLQLNHTFQIKSPTTCEQAAYSLLSYCTYNFRVGYYGWFDLSGSEEGQVAGCFKRSNENTAFHRMKGSSWLAEDLLASVSFSRRALFPWVNLASVTFSRRALLPWVNYRFLVVNIHSAQFYRTFNLGHI
jgi:hypothetical protein